MAGLTASSIVTAWDDYAQDRGQSESNLNVLLRDTLEAEFPDFSIIHSDDTILQRSNVAYAEVLQAFQQQFTTKGGVTFTPEEIRLNRVKVDLLVTPDDLVDNWLQFLADNKGTLKREDWPITKWIAERYIPGQIAADIVKNMYGAVRVAPTAGTAGAASASFNGLKKIINDAITAGKITPIVTGALSTTPGTMTTQFESFVAAIPELYQHVPKTLRVSNAIHTRYKKGKRALYGTMEGSTDVNSQIMDFEENVVRGAASMAGAPKIICSPKPNSIIAFKGYENINKLEIQAVDRQVKLFTDFHVGLGYNDLRLVWTNDQDIPE